MQSKTHIWTGLLGSTGLLVLILDSKTSLSGALDGISLCLNTVIPSLFPFFLFSILLNSTVSSMRFAFMRPIGKRLGIPAGAEPLLLLGLLGGYPIGAQCVSESFKNGHINKPDSHRLLGFCNNAGPAFIFGMGSCLFAQKSVLWVLWGTHIISALIVGFLLPNKSHGVCKLDQAVNVTITQALYHAIQAMISVCGWVVIFRVFIAFLQRWFLWLLGSQEQVFLTGLMELSNGCYCLLEFASQGMRFVMCAAFLGFGGLCVTMQTASVTNELGMGMYFPGKVMQCSISILISGILQGILFDASQRWENWMPYGVAAILILSLTLFLTHKKKRVEILC